MSRSVASFQRVCKLLDYIHSNMDQVLTLDDLSQQSCWSRWQLQRVFQHETGISVANYVREIRLSSAAELLLKGSDRVIDIGLSLGFSSEISFSRAFKQHFGVSPRLYRKQGKRFGLRKPLKPLHVLSPVQAHPQLIEVRVESTKAFDCYGVSGTFRGLLSDDPNFSVRVPKLWLQLQTQYPEVEQYPLLGVIDVTHGAADGSNLRYLAGTSENLNHAEAVNVPAQTYAVIKHKGPIAGLANTLEWFIFHWLPESEYRGVDGYELERYPMGYQCDQQHSEMEYWLPISPV